MARLTVPYDPKKGPIITIRVGFPISHHQAGSLAAAPTEIDVMVDTGARSTHIGRPVLDALGLPIVGRRRLISSNGTSMIDIFLGDVVVPGTGASFSGMPIPELPVTSEHYQGVVGRDILDQGTLTVDGPGRKIILDF